jgi:hypothetical protein
VGEFREAVQKQNAGGPLFLEPGLKHMHRETVDVVDDPGTDAGRQRRVAVGWKAARIDAAVGRAICDFFYVELHSCAFLCPR